MWTADLWFVSILYLIVSCWKKQERVAEHFVFVFVYTVLASRITQSQHYVSFMSVSISKKTRFSVKFTFIAVWFLGFFPPPVSLVCQPKSKMSATEISPVVGWLLDYLVEWMAVVAWWVGYMVMPVWLAAWKKADVANWMQIDLFCFSQVEDTIF